MSLFQKVIPTACIPIEQEAGWNTIKPASTIGRYWSLYNGALRLGVVCMCGWFLSKIGEALFGVIPSHASGTNHRTELQHGECQPATYSLGAARRNFTQANLQMIITYNNSPNQNGNTAQLKSASCSLQISNYIPVRHWPKDNSASQRYEIGCLISYLKLSAISQTMIHQPEQVL